MSARTHGKITAAAAWATAFLVGSTALGMKTAHGGLKKNTGLAVTDLTEGVYIQNEGVPLSVDRHSAPTVVDWNNDGRKDLLVGEFSGHIWLFLNVGTDAAPVFSGGSMVTADGVPIRISYG